MPTNLKNLLSRSRSKNELKLRESKDEISPAANGESNDDNGAVDNLCNTTCEYSANQLKEDDDCGCCLNSGSESSLSSGAKVTDSYLYNESDTENNCFPNNDLRYNSCSYGQSDESPSELSCYPEENFMKSLNSTRTSTTLSTMMPPGSSFHRHGPYQCSEQCYTTSSYDVVPTIGGAAVGNPGPIDYSSYFVEEKSNNVPPRMVDRMSGSDNGGGEMRRNASCSRTLFLSCNNTLHQHQPSCASFESGHMDPPPLPKSIAFSSSHASSALASGNVAAVPTSSHHQVGPSFIRNTAEGCGSLACESSSAAPCCTYNVKDGSPCQSLSMRKCETVLALSSLNNGTISTSATPITTTSGHKSSSYIRNPSEMGTYSNYPGGTTAAASLTSSGTTMSHLSSSSGVPASGTNVGGKVRVMKEKIFSTSSSALNCLLHSSSRTGKLFSGWKLSSASSSSNGGSNVNVGHMFNGSTEGSNCLGVNYQPNKHFLGASSATTTDNNKLGSAASTRSTSHPHHHLHHKSRSQLSISENSFNGGPAPLTPVNRLRRNVSVNNTSSFCPTSGSLSAHSSYSRSSSVASFVGWKEKEDPFEQSLFCRLCLSYVRLEETMEILACSCRYCKDCLIGYASFEIHEGADEIACPDASCEKQGVVELQELEQLVSPLLIEKYKKFKLFREVEKDSNLMWCPSPGCETVCHIQTGSGILTGGFVPEIDRAHVGASVVGGGAGGSRSLPFINCPTCQKIYCAGCKLSWHPDSSCESFRRKLIKQGKLSTEDDELFSLDSIKKCPFCHVPIEKDSGCAQMMCKRCKHVFCWYCLASLDDDFLLRHYDKGPCKNKLGHSRASVVWHRAQVIGIFAGFGVLVLLASPLLILAAPCLLCCRCRYCANKLDPEESDLV